MLETRESVDHLNKIVKIKEESAETFAYLVLGENYADEDSVAMSKVRFLEERLARRYGR